MNNDRYYDFSFQERYAFDSSVVDRSIAFVQDVAIYDTSTTILNQYDFFRNVSEESDRTMGFDLKFNFMLNDYVSGNIKVGSKIRTKSRTR